MSSLKKTAILITIITLGSKLLGFGREILLAYFFGTSYLVDSYLMATAIPTIYFGWINSVGVSYTPIYSNIRANSGLESSKHFTNNLVSIVLVASLIFATGGLFLSKQLVGLSAPGFGAEAFTQTLRFLKVSIWTIVFTSVAQIFTAYLNCNNRFIQSNITNLVISSTQILVIFFCGIFGDNILIYGVFISHLLHMLLLFVFSEKNELEYKFEIKVSSEIKDAFIIAVPIFVSSMIMQINTFVDKMFASQLNEGSIAALNYSAIIKQFIFYIFSIAITTMIYPMLSKYIAENNFSKAKEILSKGLNIIIILFVPITIGAIILAEPAITFVYERGQFGHDSTLMTSSAFIMYTIGLLPLAIREVITKVFYSMQDTKSTLYIGIIAVVSNVILNTILIKPMGHSGLALATSLSSIITLPLFFIILRKKIGKLGMKYSMLLFVKSCIASAVMGLIVYYSYLRIGSVLPAGNLFIILKIALASALGGLVYFVLMIIMRVEETKIFTDIIKGIIKKI